MRTVLLLCLLSLFACKIDFLESVKCIISKPKVQELGLKLFSHLYTKQYSEMLPALLKSLPDLQNAVVECLSNPNKDIVLESAGCGFSYTFCLLGCIDSSDRLCQSKCSDKYCK